MKTPVVADNKPIKVILEESKNYAWCACGKSKNQPYCDGSHADTQFTPIPFKVENTGEQYLCMCKQSDNKPFCDGTHKKLLI
ncbi:MAG: CDGSH iron-sulfur domain-containing protein [Bacteroidales bacterium]|nr:CDGSH iron-sulfur domain-containing protein [Bacteroidales bacterium]